MIVFSDKKNFSTLANEETQRIEAFDLGRVDDMAGFSSEEERKTFLEKVFFYYVSSEEENSIDKLKLLASSPISIEINEGDFYILLKKLTHYYQEENVKLRELCLEKIKLFLNYGMNPCVLFYGETPISRAVHFGDKELFKLLMEAFKKQENDKRKIDIPEMHCSALSWAVQRKSEMMCRELVLAGTDLKFPGTKMSLTPFEYLLCQQELMRKFNINGWTLNEYLMLWVFDPQSPDQFLCVADIFSKNPKIGEEFLHARKILNERGVAFERFLFVSADDKRKEGCIKIVVGAAADDYAASLCDEVKRDNANESISLEERKNKFRQALNACIVDPLQGSVDRLRELLIVNPVFTLSYFVDRSEEVHEERKLFLIENALFNVKNGFSKYGIVLSKLHLLLVYGATLGDFYSFGKNILDCLFSMVDTNLMMSRQDMSSFNLYQFDLLIYKILEMFVERGAVLDTHDLLLERFKKDEEAFYETEKNHSFLYCTAKHALYRTSEFLMSRGMHPNFSLDAHFPLLGMLYGDAELANKKEVLKLLFQYGASTSPQVFMKSIFEKDVVLSKLEPSFSETSLSRLIWKIAVKKFNAKAPSGLEGFQTRLEGEENDAREMILLLLEKGLETNVLNSEGVPYLVVFILSRQHAIVDSFLKRGAKADLPEQKFSSLYAAVLINDRELVERLVTMHAADVSFRTEGMSPFEAACKSSLSESDKNQHWLKYWVFDPNKPKDCDSILSYASTLNNDQLQTVRAIFRKRKLKKMLHRLDEVPAFSGAPSSSFEDAFTKGAHEQAVNFFDENNQSHVILLRGDEIRFLSFSVCYQQLKKKPLSLKFSDEKAERKPSAKSSASLRQKTLARKTFLAKQERKAREEREERIAALQQQKRLEEERLAAEQRLARERAEQQRLREQALRKQEEARLRHTLSMQPVESPSNVASNQKRTPVKSNQSKQVRASRPAQVQVEPSVPPVKPESEKPTQAASVSQAWHERLYQAVLSRKKEDVEVILGEKTLSEGDNEHLAQAFILLGVTQEDCVGNPITMAIRKLLVEKGAFKASMGQEGGLIFYAARHNEYYLMSACLIQAPELLTAKDREGKTPLVIAAESDSVTMCRLLLGQDASCSRIPFKDRVLALSHAAEKRAESTFSDLLKHVMHMGHTLFALLEHAHAEDLEGLCHRLVALHSGGRDGLGHSLLYRAIRANNESLTFYLERQGVSFTESEKQEFQQERNVSSVRFFAPPPLITLVPVMIVPTLPTQPQSDSFEKMRSK